MENACPVWHSGLTVKQSRTLESLDKRALNNYLPEYGLQDVSDYGVY